MCSHIIRCDRNQLDQIIVFFSIDISCSSPHPFPKTNINTHIVDTLCSFRKYSSFVFLTLRPSYTRSLSLFVFQVLLFLSISCLSKAQILSFLCSFLSTTKQSK